MHLDSQGCNHVPKAPEARGGDAKRIWEGMALAVPYCCNKENGGFSRRGFFTPSTPLPSYRLRPSPGGETDNSPGRKSWLAEEKIKREAIRPGRDWLGPTRRVSNQVCRDS